MDRLVAWLFQLMLRYNLPDFSSTEQFMRLFAQCHVPHRKGGVADMHTGAVRFLHDWNR